MKRLAVAAGLTALGAMAGVSHIAPASGAECPAAAIPADWLGDPAIAACTAAYLDLPCDVRVGRTMGKALAKVIVEKAPLFRRMDQACLRGWPDLQPYTRAFLEDIAGVIFRKEGGRLAFHCSAFRIAENVIVTARHCVFPQQGMRLGTGNLTFRLMGAPHRDIAITGHRRTESWTEDQFDLANDLEDYWYLTIADAPIPFRKSRKDYRQGAPFDRRLLVIGVNLPAYILDGNEDPDRWLEAVRWSFTEGSRRFKWTDLLAPPPGPRAREACIYYTATTYEGQSGTVILGLENPKAGESAPTLFVAGLHLRHGGGDRPTASSYDCGSYLEFNIGLALPTHVLNQVAIAPETGVRPDGKR
jgi:hypothetical protein